MSTQDAFNSSGLKTTKRRVKFQASLEDLEGRVLLSSAGPSRRGRTKRRSSTRYYPFITRKRSATHD